MSRRIILSFGLVLAAVALLPLTSRGQGRQRAQARLHPPPTSKLSLVTPRWVARHAADSNVRILDVRQDPHDYFAAHVPNAVHLSESTLRAPQQGLPVQFLPPEQLARILERAGVTPRHRVIIYSDGEDVLGATLVAYALEKLGHPDVAVMDGGFSAYEKDHETSQQYPRYTPGRMPAHVDTSLNVELAEVKRVVGQPGVVIVDARPEKAYRGDIDVWMRNGHIPGAINLDWHQLTVPGNPHQLKPVEELRRLVTAAGLKPEDDIIVYCGTNREASLEMLTLRHLLGFPRVRLYEGSWTEYAAHPELPLARGPQPREGVGGAGPREQPFQPQPQLRQSTRAPRS